MTLHPEPGQLRALAEAPDDGPVVMLNLLRYPERPGGEDRDGGFRRYGRNVQERLEAVGAEVRWRGRVDSVVIGDDEADGWDEVILVEYPSRAAFLEMTSSPQYREVAQDRTAGLADSRLLALTEIHGGS